MPSVSLARHGDGWRVVWREAGRGSKRRVSETRKTKAEAGADADVIRARLIAAKALPRSRVRLPWSEIVDRWYLSRPPGRYRDEAKIILRSFAWAEMSDVTSDAVAALKLGKRRLINSVLTYARSRLKQVVDQDIADQPMPKGKGRARPSLLSDDEVDALVREAGEWSAGNGAIAHLVATYGHRAASLVQLPASAVDLEAGTLTLIVKSGDVVRHGLLPETVAILRALKREGKQPLFLNQDGVPWKTGKSFAEWFYHRVGPVALAPTDPAGKRLPRRKGRKVGYYQAKSAAITRMLDRTNNDAKTVASITGHRRPSLLIDVYARTNDARQRAALAGARPAGVGAKPEPGVTHKKS